MIKEKASLEEATEHIVGVFYFSQFLSSWQQRVVFVSQTEEIASGRTPQRKAGRTPTTTKVDKRNTGGLTLSDADAVPMQT